LTDKSVSAAALAALVLPTFLTALLLLQLFSYIARSGNVWLQPGYVPLTQSPGQWLGRMILPWIAIAATQVGATARLTRSAVLDVLGEDYIRTARAKGQSERKVLFRHALRNAAVPIVTVIGLGVALLIGGVVVTESVFTIPGLGRLTVDAVLARDYPTIQAVILLFSFVYVMINLAVDMIYTVLDPRIRY
jgi:peptide/nickel transport system permease protein